MPFKAFLPSGVIVAPIAAGSGMYRLQRLADAGFDTQLGAPPLSGLPGQVRADARDPQYEGHDENRRQCVPDLLSSTHSSLLWGGAGRPIKGG